VSLALRLQPASLRWVPLLAVIAMPARAQETPSAEWHWPALPTNAHARDHPNDAGTAVDLTWTKSPDDGAGRNDVTGYVIVRVQEEDGAVSYLPPVPPGTEAHTDDRATANTRYDYYILPQSFVAPLELRFWKDPVDILAEAQSVYDDALAGAATGSVTPVGNWFHTDRINILIGALITCSLVIYFIARARKGHELYVRPIPGIEALDDAIGRATEMGRPILYVSGLDPASSISTIAAMIILSRVARRVAEYDARLLVPCVDPIVMNTEQEIVKEAYIDAGRPDAYDPDCVFYVTDSQFAYVAAVDGIMMREKPAANLYMGYFYAEALILAETGAATGAIQIAGTDADTQLPFFVTACDYTLMGEELYAATAYLSREPLMLGSLKGQDAGKLIITLLLIVGVACASLAALSQVALPAPLSKLLDQLVHRYFIDLFTAH
jgi:hypothetical protein